MLAQFVIGMLIICSLLLLVAWAFEAVGAEVRGWSGPRRAEPDADEWGDWSRQEW